MGTAVSPSSLSPLRALCILIDAKNTHIRAGMHKLHGMTELLVANAFERDTSSSLVVWASNRRTHLTLGLNYPDLVKILTSTDDEMVQANILKVIRCFITNPSAMTANIRNKEALSRQAAFLVEYASRDCGSALNQLAVMARMLEAGDLKKVVRELTNQGTLAKALKRPDTHVLNFVVSVVAIPKVFEFFLSQITPIVMENFAEDASNHHLVALVAKTCKKTDYRPAIFHSDVLAPNLVVELAYTFSCQGVDLTENSAWKTKLEPLLMSGIDDAFRCGNALCNHAHVTSTLLNLVYKSLGKETLRALTRILSVFPHLFAFKMTDSEDEMAGVLKVGAFLKLPSCATQRYAIHLENLVSERKTKEKMSSLDLPLELPDVFHCPITMDIMRDPVVASDGHTYERLSLSELIRRQKSSPMTREVLDPRVVIPNIALRKRIRSYIDEVCSIVEEDRSSNKRFKVNRKDDVRDTAEEEVMCDVD